jgi:hypothetical protein
MDTLKRWLAALLHSEKWWTFVLEVLGVYAAFALGQMELETARTLVIGLILALLGLQTVPPTFRHVRRLVRR